MEGNFLCNMESYQKILNKESISWFLIALLGLVLAITFFFVLRKYKEMEAIVMRIISTIVFLAFFCLSLSLSIVLKIDAKDNNILFYEGSYTLHTQGTVTACYMPELNDEKYNVIINTGLRPGTINKRGYVVYTKYSKVVVDYGTIH